MGRSEKSSAWCQSLVSTPELQNPNKLWRRKGLLATISAAYPISILAIHRATLASNSCIFSWVTSSSNSAHLVLSWSKATWPLSNSYFRRSDASRAVLHASCSFMSRAATLSVPSRAALICCSVLTTLALSLLSSLAILLEATTFKIQAGHTGYCRKKIWLSRQKNTYKWSRRHSCAGSDSSAQLPGAES